MKKVSKIIAEFLVNKGVKDVFTITGGGAMHLNDALGHEAELNCIYNHHEQACSIAAEGYARDTGKIAAVCVTSGPGGTNAITGVLGGYQDSIPMFVISGQVKRITTIHATDVPLRQLGDQEFDIVTSVKNMTKYAEIIMEKNDIYYHLEKAWFLANNGRKGPVWLDIPLDIQAAQVEENELRHFEGSDEEKELSKLENPVFDEAIAQTILEKIQKAKRPVIFAGTAINYAGALKEFRDCIDSLKIPVVTAWNAHDLVPDEHPLYAGRPGTVGNRGGNFNVQNADLLLVLGSRLNIRLISYNYENFAKDAYKIIVDIDANELKKPTVTPDLPVHANVKDVMQVLSLLAKKQGAGNHEEWTRYCVELNKKYPAAKPEYFKSKKLNPYAFTDELFRKYLSDGDHVACGNGSACVITFQACVIKENQRVFTNSGTAAMGYGFPAALGVAVARKGERTICIDGDGSFQMNIQELQTIIHNNLNVKTVIINNNGYHSIRQTQRNIFNPPMVGVCSDNGISFPDLSKLIPAYGMQYYRVTSLKEMEETVPSFLNFEGPALLEVIVDEEQNFEPKLSSKQLPDGTMVSPTLDDMYPFLPEEEYKANKDVSRF